MRWNREEYIALMTYQPVERPMFVELFGPLVGLEEEWRRQGASEAEIELTAFDWDYVPLVSCGGQTGMRGGQKPRILEDTAEYTISTDELGRTMKLIKSSASIALPLDHPVKDMDSWRRLKPLFTFCEERVNHEQLAQAKQAQLEGQLVWASIPGGYDLPRRLMGEAGACLCYYENPELMHDILTTLTDTALKVLERVSDQLTIDNLRVHEDLAGKSGPLVGPQQIEEFIAPYYRAVWDLVSARGTRLFSQDSDGNIGAVMEPFAAAGVNIMYPMEPAAGMDMVRARQLYGTTVAYKGGIDKHVLREDSGAIERELEYKMQPLMRQGGVVFGLDHRIPNGTPIANYRYYVDCGRELLGLPPRNPKQSGWARMAF